MSRELIHFLGKDVRKKIIEIIVKEYGKAGAAEILGVSKASITKYMSGKMHASDETLFKAFESVDETTRKKIIIVIGEELLEFLKEFNYIIKNQVTDRSMNLLVEEIVKELVSITKSLSGSI